MSSIVARKILTEDHLAATLFLSLLFNSGGFGVLSNQFYFYSSTFRHESMYLKTIVFAVYLLELAQTTLMTRTLFRSLVYGFLDKNGLDKIHDHWFSVPVIGGLVACIVQLFYAYRIVHLTRCFRHKRSALIGIVGFVIILSLGQLVGGITLGIEMAHLRLFSKIVTNATRISAMLWLGGEVLCDICIAICMFHLLRCVKVEKTSTTRTHAQRVIRLTVETGAMTATIALLNVLLILTHGSKLYYQPSSAAVSKLYSNTLLLSLNSRINPSPEASTPDIYSTRVSFCDINYRHATTESSFGSLAANNSTTQSRR